MNFYQFIVPRLNGDGIEKNFDYYLNLVKKGIAGFIVFGGKLETVRNGIRKLQEAAKRPLIIASDLERGLGQQLEGGTLFPPAMAIASAIKKVQKSEVRSQKLAEANRRTPNSRLGESPKETELRAIMSQDVKLLRETFKTIAIEARYAGINTIFAPVLDINTNPKNPIISTRAFGEDAGTVSFFGCEMIKTLQKHGVTACGKHFPGHGDTEIDSHIKLPVINKNLKSIRETELIPFKSAIEAGVKMIMLGHLKVPALDPSGVPVSLSARAVRYLRDKMKFKGIIITDALNMGGIGKYSEEKASAMALEAGVDLLLHPTDPDRIASYLERAVTSHKLQVSRNLIIKKKAAISLPDFEKHRKLSEELTRQAIRISAKIKVERSPYLVVLDDDGNYKYNSLIQQLKKKFSYLTFKIVNRDSDVQKITFPDNSFVIVAIFSKIKAWKGGPRQWLLRAMKKLEGKADVFISFGSPYILDRIGTVPLTKIYAYWDSESAQRAVAELI